MTYTNYPVGDFLIQVKNAALARLKELTLRKTNLIVATAESLKEAGYVDKVTVEEDTVTLKLTQKHKQPLLMDLKLVSKPGLRVYVSVDEIKARRSPAMLILSTPKGVMTSKRAIKENVGGEVLAEIW